MINVDYVRHDLDRIATLLRIGFMRVPHEYMSEDDAIMRTAFNDILKLSENIKKQAGGKGENRNAVKF